jgi:hypothetical protein
VVEVLRPQSQRAIVVPVQLPCSKNRFFRKRTTFFRKKQDFSANSQICGKGPFHLDTIPPEQATLPWPSWQSMCVLRRTTRRRNLVTLWLHRDWRRYSKTTVPYQEATFQLEAAGRLAGPKEIATLGDGPSRLVLRILIAVTRALRNACWHWGDLWRGLTLPAQKTPLSAVGNCGTGWVDQYAKISVICDVQCHWFWIVYTLMATLVD